MAKKPIGQRWGSLVDSSQHDLRIDRIIDVLTDLIKAISQLDLVVREHIAQTKYEKRKKK